jgi:hypothetical protein
MILFLTTFVTWPGQFDRIHLDEFLNSINKLNNDHAICHYVSFFPETTGLWAGVLGFDSRRGLETFLFTTASRTALGPTQSSIQWVPGGSFPGCKTAGA